MPATLYSDLNHWLLMAMLGSARLLPLFILLPYLSQSIVTGLFKFPLVLLLGASLWQGQGEQVAQLEIISFSGMMLRELLIGLTIALFFCFPFWVMHAAGSLIDNQRGATLSSTLNPLSGIDTSELANLFNMVAVAITLQAGGILTLLQAMQQSYQLWPPLTTTLPEIRQLASYLGELMKNALRFSAPVISVFLISEFFLGLLSRYTPQMNAFSLALSLKTLIGFFVLLLYFSPLMPADVLRLGHFFLPLR